MYAEAAAQLIKMSSEVNELIFYLSAVRLTENVYSTVRESMFYKLRRILPLKVLKQVYFAFVHSHILYAVEIYANTRKAYLDKLIKLNNKLLRIIQNKPRKTHVTELYENYSTLPVLLLHQQNLILFAHKILHCPQKLPDLFRRYLNKNDDSHTYNTRLKDSIHLHCVSKKTVPVLFCE